ncbi:glucuronate isomerase [Sphingobacterium rhinopitheci]|uniref:glucuronate isomerase n=1 Tax=Sphingobacterium rhinopitheci TaxID=2781960 RepID=UPI001F525D11|nr:glucuronate isomerase [Sphingobacterium rhinopitheci]MCI0921543.1 glucuronate isomerase [Sphingobacterium rhinopitheci]
MKTFIDDNFLLHTPFAQELYTNYAKDLPIIDYHNHLRPEQIANDIQFENITQVWLEGDHYKWRVMRANGVDEKYITGDASDKEKFMKWAETVPYMMRNPLYHWTHLELKRYFGIDERLNRDTADRIFEITTDMLVTSEYSARNLLKMMNVEVICTTDDPLDSLTYHQQFVKEKESFKMVPTYRPDKAINTDDIDALNAYIDQLSAVVGLAIATADDYLYALKLRHNYFAANGCSVADHALEYMCAVDYTDAEIERIFTKIRANSTLSAIESIQFKSAMLFNFAIWNHERGWVQQYHLGALRNNNTRMLRDIGANMGYDSVGDFSQAKALSRFLNRLDSSGQLTKTIVYNLNPADNEVIATMLGNFNDGITAGKMQYGAAWWFSDQKEGMTKQINTLSNMGVLSRTIGMLTDSRSILSFPRHEYYRRIMCDIFGKDVDNKELPNDIEWIGKIVQDISYNNAKAYFKFYLANT